MFRRFADRRDKGFEPFRHGQRVSGAGRTGEKLSESGIRYPRRQGRKTLAAELHPDLLRRALRLFTRVIGAACLTQLQLQPPDRMGFASHRLPPKVRPMKKACTLKPPLRALILRLVAELFYRAPLLFCADRCMRSGGRTRLHPVAIPVSSANFSVASLMRRSRRPVGPST